MASSDVDRELETLIRARYPIIYIVSWEEKRVEDALRAIAQARGKKIFFWTITQGMVLNPNHRDNATRDPIAALDFVMESRDQALFVLKDYHAFIADVTVTRRLRDLTLALKTSYKTLLILAPMLKLPAELEKDITVVDYGLPDRDDLDQLLEGIIQSVKDNPQIDTTLTELERDQVLKAAQGLTANEAENVFAKSLVEKKKFDVDVILGEKEQIIRKSGILEYYPFSEQLSDVGGLDLLKQWMQKRTVAFTEKALNFGLPAPRGVLLLGVQGGGKSLSAKAIGALWRLPLLRLDVGRIFGGIVGQSEENMRKAIRVAESVAPCVAGETRITLADGSERAIQDLYESEIAHLEVLAMNAQWQLVPTPVRAITRRPAPDLYEVRLKHSRLNATSNHLHPVLRDGELTWVRTDALQTTDFVAVPAAIPTRQEMPPMRDFLPPDTRFYADEALSYARLEHQTPQRRYAARKRGANYVRVRELARANCYPSFSTVRRFALGRGGTADCSLSRLPDQLPVELGYLLGLITSDGFLSRRGIRTGFVNTDLDLHKRFAEILCRQFGLRTTLRLNTASRKNARLSGTTTQSIFRPCYSSYVDNVLLHRLLSNIQARLLTLPTRFVNAWLRGYFDGDGYIADGEAKDPKVVLTSKIPAINQLVRSALLRAGFLTTNPGHAHIEITGTQNVRRFIAQIGSEHPCKKARMDAWMRRPVSIEPKDRTDLIPIGSRLRRVRQALGIGSQALQAAGPGLMNRYERGQGHPNRARLRALVAELRGYALRRGADTRELDAIQALLDSPVAWSQVVSVTKIETPEYVYDLACAENHTFIAENVITHNCILWIDELEKGFSGTQSSGVSDGGTTARVFGTFLTWMQDKKAATFVVATSNDVTALPPELLRKGRFDEIFFIDLPAEVERKQIFEIHLRKRKRDPAEFDLDRLAAMTPGFSGAEIEALVVESLYNAFDGETPLTTEAILETAQHTVPLAMTMREKIEQLREWASTRARPASSAKAEDMQTIAEELILAKYAAPDLLEPGANSPPAMDGNAATTEPTAARESPADVE